MRSCLTPIAILAAILAFALWNGSHMADSTDRWRDQLQQVDALAQADYATTIIPSKQASDALRRRGWYYFDPRYSVPYTFCVATLRHAYISMAAQKLLNLLYELRGTF